MKDSKVREIAREMFDGMGTMTVVRVPEHASVNVTADGSVIFVDAVIRLEAADVEDYARIMKGGA